MINKTELLKIGAMAGGGIIGSIAQSTTKSSLNVEDALVSAATTAGTIFLASKLKGNMQNMALGAAAVMAMNTISEGANMLAQKSANPTIDKIAELLPTVIAPNMLANPSLDIPVDNFEDTDFTEDQAQDIIEEGVNGLNGYGKSLSELAV